MKIEKMVKFDVERERFVMYLRLAGDTGQRTEWSAAETVGYGVPIRFRAAWRLEHLPNGLMLAPEADEQIEVDNGCLLYEIAMTDEEIVRAAGPVYRHWLSAIAEAREMQLVF